MFTCEKKEQLITCLLFLSPQPKSAGLPADVTATQVCGSRWNSSRPVDLVATLIRLSNNQHAVNGRCQKEEFSQIYVTLWLQTLLLLRAPSRHPFVRMRHSWESSKRWSAADRSCRAAEPEADADNAQVNRSTPPNHCRLQTPALTFDLWPAREWQKKIGLRRKEKRKKGGNGTEEKTHKKQNQESTITFHLYLRLAE